MPYVFGGRRVGGVIVLALAAAGAVASRAQDPARPTSRPATAATTTAPSSSAPGELDASAVVAALASKDEAARRRAADDVKALGPDARPALVRAINGADASVRMAAAPLLLDLPFDAPDDPPDVRAILRDYGKGNANADARKAAVAKIAVMSNPAVPRVLFRLMREEPADDVRWYVLGHIRRVQAIAAARALPAVAPQDIPRAPNLSLAASVAAATDPVLAVALYERAIELELRTPTTEPEVAATYFELANLYTQRRRYEDAAEVHRRGYARNPNVRFNSPTLPSTDHLQSLFTLHALHGPLKGFAQDLAAYAPQISRPHLMYAVGRVYERSGRPLVAQAIYRAAGLCTPDAPQARDEVVRYARTLGVVGPAEQMYEAILAGTVPGLSDASAEAVNAHVHLAGIAGARGQDFVAAEHLRQVVEHPLPSDGRLTVRRPGVMTRTGRGVAARNALEAEMHWRYLRAARAKNDANSITAHLKELARLMPDNTDIVVDAVPLLRERNRPDDARRLFESAYATAKSILSHSPDDPVQMTQVAWLCARCGERLDEAKRLVDGALARDGDNPGYLDTAAEVEFQLGHVEEAIRLETRALELRPADPFMTEQLNRFRDKAGRK